MENFTYYNPTRIEFGKEKEKNIGEYIAEYGIKRVLLCYGSERIKKDGLFDIATQSLAKHGISFVELGGIISNPVLSKVQEGIKCAKEHSVEAVLAIGGGSVLDSAKAIAAGTLSTHDVWDMYLGNVPVEKALPIFDIMTLAATGSEMNGFSVLTNEITKQKYSIASAHINPKVSVINPLLMQSISKEYLVYSASDIIAHCIEGYFTASIHPHFQCGMIENIIKTVIKTTETLLENPKDYDARAEFAWAATQALNGLTYAGTAGFSYPNHMIEHSLSAICNVAHGAGLSVVMPAWMKWYMTQNEAQFKRFAKEIFGQNSAKEGIEALEMWFKKIGTPTTLEALGVDSHTLENVIDNVTQNAIYFGMSAYTKETIRTIFTFAH